MTHVCEVPRVLVRHSFGSNQFLDFFLRSRVAYYFPHKVELVLVEESEVDQIQHLRRPLDEEVRTLAGNNVVRVDLVSSLLQQRHSITLSLVDLLQPVKVVFPILEQLLLERRLEEKVVIVVLRVVVLV